MDYLPVFHSSQELRIPCVKSSEYQYQGYYQYLASHPLQNYSAVHERETWIQELLFFSVIHDFSRCAEIVILPIHLVKVDDGWEYLTTETLQNAVIEKIRSKAVLKKFRRRIPIATCLGFQGVLIDASDTLFRLFPDLHAADRNDIRSNILLSIATCLESLNHALVHLFGSDLTNLSLPRMDKYIEERMTRAGWCRSKIQDFLPFNPCAGYLATQLQPSRQHQHEDHRSCSVRQCLPSTNRAKYFRPKHIDGCTSNCPDLSVDADALETIIANEYLPIVHVEEGDSQVVLRVKKRRRSSRAKGYVAISHVWSHGLGNEDANSLPLCQVKRISNLIRRKFPGRGLWMDTLCIPRYRKIVVQAESPTRQAEMKRYRLMAIERMAEIYELADAVVVLDEQLDSVGSNRYQRQLSLTCSDWMGRLWTLQEAIKGFQCLHVKFGDDLVTIQDLLSFDQQRPDSSSFCLSSHGLDEEINSSVSYEFSALQFGGHVFEGEKSLAPLIQTLRRRATTDSKDEVICLITILGLKSNLIHQELSMSNFLRNLEAIPEDLVFYPGERLTEHGFRWAPKTFLTQPPTIFSLYGDTHGISLVSSDGDMKGLLICKDVIWIHEAFYFHSHQSADSKEYQAYIANDSGSGRTAVLFRADRSIDLDSKQLESRHIPPISPNSFSPLMDVWSESRACHPAALVVYQGRVDEEDVATSENIEHAVLISNIRAYSSNQGAECIYGGDYELLVRCFSLGQVSDEVRRSAVQLRTSFRSRVPIALS